MYRQNVQSTIQGKCCFSRTDFHYDSNKCISSCSDNISSRSAGAWPARDAVLASLTTRPVHGTVGRLDTAYRNAYARHTKGGHIRSVGTIQHLSPKLTDKDHK